MTREHPNLCGASNRRGDGSPWAGRHVCVKPEEHDGKHACAACGFEWLG